MLVLTLEFVVCFKAIFFDTMDRQPGPSAPAGAARYTIAVLPTPIRTVILEAFQLIKN